MESELFEPKFRLSNCPKPTDHLQVREVGHTITVGITSGGGLPSRENQLQVAEADFTVTIEVAGKAHRRPRRTFGWSILDQGTRCR